MLSGGRVTWIRSKNGVFTTKSAWDFFREKGSPVPWHKILWFSGSVPRHAMIRLLEVDWILWTDWPPLVFPNPSLVLCATGKTRVWITFSSLANSLIWHSLFNKCNLPCTFSCWEDFFQDVANRFKGQSLRDLIIKLMMAAGVYIVWKERNSRLFRRKSRDVTSVFLDIVLHVRFRMNSLTGFPPSCVNRWLVCSWGFSENLLHNG